MNRADALQRLRDHQGAFDIAIVGGGASGLGAAVDAAARGYSVVLIEQSDFAKGTSSRSTKLVHGGVRYLKQGNVSLVLEALRERGLLCRNAPHLVHSLPFVIPNYHWWEGPFYGIGLKVYDMLAGRLGLEPSRYLSPDEVLALLPTIETEHLTGGVIYHDGQFDDSRLAIHLAMTANDHGAVMLNHVKCTGLLKTSGHVHGVTARDELDGTSFEIEARCVVNATGVFVDELRKLDDPAVQSMVSPSQGIHFVLPRDFLPGDAAIMIPKTDDGRVLFAVPWHGCVVVGTTDTAVPHASMEPRALPEEIDYVMTHAARYLTRDPTPADVLSVFAGLRPLVRNDGAANTASISRDHAIVISDSGLLTVTGGKWTTYRKMAEDVIDHASLIACLDHRPCGTSELQLHGATTEQAVAEHLRPYGSDLKHIDDLIAADASLAARVHPRLNMQRAEVLWHVRSEMACTVEDVLARRTRSLLLDARASSEAAQSVAEIMAAELGKDEAWIAQQTADYRSLAAGYVL